MNDFSDLKNSITEAENDEEIEELLEKAWRDARNQSHNLSAAYTMFTVIGEDDFDADDVLQLLDKPVNEEDIEEGVHK